MKKKLVSIIMMVVLCATTLLAGCGKEEQGSTQAASNGKDPADVLVLKVGDDEVYLNEVNYYALAFLSSMGVADGTDLSTYFSEQYPTMDEAYKAQLLMQIRQSKILYLKAVEEGISLTDDEVAEVDSEADKFMENYDKDKQAKFGLDKDLLTHVFTQIYMIRKLESQLASNVEQTETVSYGTIEKLVFLRVKIDESGNAVTDADGNYEYLSEDEQAQKKAQAEEALARLKDGEDLDDLIAEYDLAATSGTTHATSDSIKETYGLSDGEISDVIENEYGYTIIKVVASEDQDYTDSVNSYYQNSATQEAVKNQEQEWFDAFPISDDDVETDVWNAFSLQEFL